MTSGVYQRGDNQKKNIALALIGNKNAIGHIPWNKGIPMNELTKNKISDAKIKNPTRFWLGKKRPEMKNVAGFNRTGISAWNNGKICPQLSKEKHWNWQGGKSDERHDFYFKNVISPYLREKYGCLVCKTKKDLVVHHSDLNKHNNKITNMIVLCRSHHSQMHHIILEVSRW